MCAEIVTVCVGGAALPKSLLSIITQQDDRVAVVYTVSFSVGTATQENNTAASASRHVCYGLGSSGDGTLV